MNFDEFWIRLALKLCCRKRLRTLKRKCPFEAVMAEPYIVEVTPESTKMARDVNQKDFWKVWRLMKNDTRSERYVNRGGRYYKFWSISYMCAMIDSVVGDQTME